MDLLKNAFKEICLSCQYKDRALIRKGKGDSCCSRSVLLFFDNLPSYDFLSSESRMSWVRIVQFLRQATRKVKCFAACFFSDEAVCQPSPGNANLVCTVHNRVVFSERVWARAKARCKAWIVYTTKGLHVLIRTRCTAQTAAKGIWSAQWVWTTDTCKGCMDCFQQTINSLLLRCT